MGRHSKKDTPAAPVITQGTGPADPGAQFDALLNQSLANGAAAGPQTADDRIAALKNALSSHRRKKD